MGSDKSVASIGIVTQRHPIFATHSPGGAIFSLLRFEHPLKETQVLQHQPLSER